MVSRVEVFVARGVNLIDATALADKLVTRDRDGDDRRACLECEHLSGWAGGRRCSAWRRAGIGGQSIPADMVAMLKRCNGYGHLDSAAEAAP